MIIALYINCFSGNFVPYGPFDAEDVAWIWIRKRQNPELYTVLTVKKVED